MGKIDKEKKTVSVMIDIYCRKKHNTTKELCTECAELKEYAMKRLNSCKFGENKGNCGDCKIHCYKKDMRAKIIEVMKFSGPRMVFSHPLMALDHLISKFKK